MNSLTGILVLSVAVLAAGDMPFNKDSIDLEAINFPSPFADDTDFRLPNNTIPIHYDILLSTNIHDAEYEFFGTVNILFKPDTTKNEITLQHRQLTISKVDLYDQDQVLIQPEVDFESNSDYAEFLIITPTDNFDITRNYIVKIEYEGIIRDDMGGFYRSSYINAKGETVWLAATQFESTNARHAFPCYDEPGIRATYSLSIKHHKSYIALSNMLESIPEPVPATDFVITKFDKTPITFQSYLVAFVVCDFKMIEDSTADPPQRVFATPEQIANKDADFALDFGVKSLKALEEYLGVKYLLPKLDQVLVPDFAAGAMENYGLVTYREANLLYNPKTNSVDRQIRVAEVIAHEYAHQWFGNHVGPAWWDYIWLNEGFAALFQNYATHLVFPEWREMEIFVVGVVQYVFQSDSLDPRPMTVYRNTPELLASTGGDVTYSKSGSVLRMLQMVMTEPTFAKGLNLYLNNWEQKSANSENLWENMQAGYLLDNPLSDLDIPAFMRTWELQSGFPVVKVERTNNVLLLSQERYYQNFIRDTSNQIWSIPLSYATASNPGFTQTTPDLWLNERSRTVTSTSAPKTWNVDDWVLFNLQETGYYRVNYDLTLWKLLTDELVKGDITKFHTTNRAQLIDDSFNLARTDRLTYNVPLEIVTYLSRESDYIPWAAFNRALSFLHPHLMGSQYYGHFKQLVLENVNAFYTRLGATSKPATDELMDRLGRNLAIGWACQMGHEKCLSDTTAQMSDVVDQKLVVEPDLESAIYCNGIRVANKFTFDALWDFALVPNNKASKSLILGSLGCSNDETLLDFLLQSTLNGEFAYTLEDRLQVFNSVFLNGGIAGYDMAIEFLLASSESSLDLFFANQIPNILNNLVNRVSTVNQKAKIVLLLNKLGSNLTPANVESINKTLEDRTAWSAKNMGTIEAWLIANVNIDPPETTTAINTSTNRIETSTNRIETSTNRIETTTDGSSILIGSAFTVFMALFVQIMRVFY